MKSNQAGVHKSPHIANDEQTTVVTYEEIQIYMPYAPARLKRISREAMFQSATKFEVPTTDFNEAKSKYNKMRLWERDLAFACCRNNDGIALEKDGKIEEAIKAYEDNIELGFPAMHSYTRLMIIYRRLKDFENEQRVIHRAIEVYTNAGMIIDDIMKWEKRLEKSKLLQSKNK